MIGGRLFLAILGGTACALMALACEPTPPRGTGGVIVDEVFGASGESCGRGIAVGMIDEHYTSTNIALVGLDGKTLSGSFISSASAGPSLNAALSGDVEFPSERMTSDIILIDRYVVSVISFVDIETAQVRDQISVRTGFQANPQDYVALPGGRALVSRLEKNRAPGAEEFDQGDDLLVLDLAQGEVTGRIDLTKYAGAATERARPGTMVRDEAHIYLTLTRHNSSFSDAEQAALLTLDGVTGEPISAYEVQGMKNCVLASAADERRLALSCAGLISDANDSGQPDSGLIVLRILKDGPTGAPRFIEEFRVTSETLGYGPFAPSVTFASDDLLWARTYGALEGEDAGRPDRVLSFNLKTGAFEVLLASKDEAFTLGDVLCVPACGTCFIADAGRGVLHRYSVAQTTISAPSQHVVENEVGLPPRVLGAF